MVADDVVARTIRGRDGGSPVSVLARLLSPNADGDLEIEPMRRRHIGQALTIEHDAYPNGWSHRLFLSELDQVSSGLRHYLVARRGRTVVGYAGMMFVPDEAHITNVAVAADARRQGIATQLLVRLADEAIRRDCPAWTLEVRASSSGAQALYRSFGFAPVGVRKRYYDNVEDAIVMWCYDIQSAEYGERIRQLAATGER